MEDLIAIIRGNLNLEHNQFYPDLVFFEREGTGKPILSLVILLLTQNHLE